MAGGEALATAFCVSSSSGLTQALFIASNNNEADVMRLQTGNCRSTRPDGFTRDHTGGSLELSGGWSFGCVVRSPGARSTIDGEYERRALQLEGNDPGLVTVRVAHLSILRGVDDQVGGLLVTSGGAGTLHVEVEDNRFHDNTQAQTSDGTAGALLVSADRIGVFGNLFTENHAANSNAAGQLTCYGAVGAVTNNNTAVGSTAEFGQSNMRGGFRLGGGCPWEVANNSLSDNEGYDLSGESDEAIVRNNNIDDLYETPITGSSGNINIDPLFESVGVLRLTRGSPMVDAGFNEALLGLPLRSFDGGIRVAGPHIDIGAYELGVLFKDDFDPLFSDAFPGPSP